LTLNALAGALRRRHRQLVAEVEDHRATRLAELQPAVDETGAEYRDLVSQLGGARLAYHAAAAELAWWSDMGASQWESFKPRLPVSRLIALDPALKVLDADAGRLVSAHLSSLLPDLTGGK
jgi:hypothetical protein